MGLEEGFVEERFGRGIEGEGMEGNRTRQDFASMLRQFAERKSKPKMG